MEDVILTFHKIKEYLLAQVSEGTRELLGDRLIQFGLGLTFGSWLIGVPYMLIDKEFGSQVLFYAREPLLGGFILVVMVVVAHLFEALSK